jgi:uncharacterized protein DUF6589
VRQAVRQARGEMDVEPDRKHANQEQAAKLLADCKRPQDAVLLQAVATSIAEMHPTERTVTDRERQALATLLQCGNKCWDTEYILQATRQGHHKLGVLYNWYDEFVNAVLVFHDAIRSAEHDVIIACRKKLLLVFFIANNTQYARLTAAELIKLEYQLEADVVRFMLQMQLANLSGVRNKFQGTDAIMEEYIRRLLKLVHNANSPRAYDVANHNMLTVEQKSDAVTSSLALPQKSEARRQKTMWDMECEIQAATDLFRPHTMAVGAASTLGGKLLTPEAARLETIAVERVGRFHEKYIRKGGGKIWAKKWEANLAKTPKLLAGKQAAKEKKQKAPRRGKKRSRDVSCFLVSNLLSSPDTLAEYEDDRGSDDEEGSDDVDQVGRDEPLFREDGIQDTLRKVVRRSAAEARSLLPPGKRQKA